MSRDPPASIGPDPVRPPRRACPVEAHTSLTTKRRPDQPADRTSYEVMEGVDGSMLLQKTPHSTKHSDLIVLEMVRNET